MQTIATRIIRRLYPGTEFVTQRGSPRKVRAMSRTHYAPLFLTLLAACGGGGDLPCEGKCGTISVRATVVDTSEQPTTCAATGVAKFAITLKREDQTVLATRELACDASTDFGPTSAGFFYVTARALDASQVSLAEDTRTTTLVIANDHADVVLQLVPGTPSVLGQACTGSCANGASCINVSGGGGASFCSPTCGMGSSQNAPEHGDLACVQGYVGVGKPSCSLYAGSGSSVTWSCGIRCGDNNVCPDGMTCQAGSPSLCVR